MSVNYQLIAAAPSGKKVGPIKTIILRESADLGNPEIYKTKDSGPINLNSGIRLDLFRDDNIDIFNPYI
jgi:hypothetical protein